VSNYADNIKLFRTALDKHGKVDHAVAVAGIVERGKWFDPDLTIETVEKPESIQTLEINFLGSAYLTRIATVYLKHGREEGEDKSITLISSAAGFRDSPGLFMYQVWTVIIVSARSPISSERMQCSKHGVMGILRGLRKILYERDQVSFPWRILKARNLIELLFEIRINAICPAVTDTQMTVSIIDSFRKTGQAINTPEGVAQYIVGMEIKPELNGKAVYSEFQYTSGNFDRYLTRVAVEGNRGWEIMDGLDRTMSDWLGEEPTARMWQHLETIKSVGCQRRCRLNTSLQMPKGDAWNFDDKK
jgi:NAD(P)-dependent dehydrogenase (short-subunit alcohol dehydrogenase family)